MVRVAFERPGGLQERAGGKTDDVVSELAEKNASNVSKARLPEPQKFACELTSSYWSIVWGLKEGLMEELQAVSAGSPFSLRSESISNSDRARPVAFRRREPSLQTPTAILNPLASMSGLNDETLHRVSTEALFEFEPVCLLLHRVADSPAPCPPTRPHSVIAPHHHPRPFDSPGPPTNPDPTRSLS